MDNSNNKLAAMKALKNGNGIQYLLNMAYKIMGNPIVMIGIYYELLAHIENVVTDDRLWNEIITNGKFSIKSIEFFVDEYFLDTVANAKGVAFLACDKLKYDRIVGNIRNKDNIKIGNIVIVACSKPFEDDDLMLSKILCKKVSKEVANIEFYQNYGKIYQENVVKELIDGSIHDKKFYSGYVATIYEGLKSNLYLGVVDIGQCDPEYARLQYFRDLFKQTQAEFKYFIYSKYIVIIFSSSNMKTNAKKYLHKLNRLFEQNNMRVGISSCFDNLFELRKYYLEAIGALGHSLEKDSNEFAICRNQHNIIRTV